MVTLSSAILVATSFPPISGLAFQVQTPGTDNSGLMVVFMGIAAVSLLVLALVVVGVLTALVVVGVKANKAAGSTLVEVKAKVYPLIDKATGLVGDLTPTIKSIAVKADTLVGEMTPSLKAISERTHALVEDLSPKISGISDDVHGITSRALEIAEFAKERVQEFGPAIAAAKETITEANNTARSANEKTARQVERVNEIVTGVLDWTEQIPLRIKEGVSGPSQKLGQVANQMRGKWLSVLFSTKGLWKKFA